MCLKSVTSNDSSFRLTKRRVVSILCSRMLGPQNMRLSGEITEEFFDSIFDVNVKGLLFTVQKALLLLKDGASIVLCASVVASKGLPSNSVYSATKAAVRSFARTWATDLRSRRIRVNAVSPGSTDTPGLSELLGSSETGQQRLKMISNVRSEERRVGK